MAQDVAAAFVEESLEESDEELDEVDFSDDELEPLLDVLEPFEPLRLSVR